MHENREVSAVPVVEVKTGRLGKVDDRKPNTNAAEKSDIGIVPGKGPNKPA
jgi:hypothetical protein